MAHTNISATQQSGLACAWSYSCDQGRSSSFLLPHKQKISSDDFNTIKDWWQSEIWHWCGAWTGFRRLSPSPPRLSTEPFKMFLKSDVIAPILFLLSSTHSTSSLLKRELLLLVETVTKLGQPCLPREQWPRGHTMSPKAFLKEFPLFPWGHMLLELVTPIALLYQTRDPGKKGEAQRFHSCSFQPLEGLGKPEHWSDLGHMPLHGIKGICGRLGEVLKGQTWAQQTSMMWRRRTS